MANKIIDTDSLVKFPVKGGFAIAKVLTINNDIATVQTPTDYIMDVNLKDLQLCTKKEYNKNLKDLASNFEAKANDCKEDEEEVIMANSTTSEANMKEVEAKLQASEANVTSLQAKLAEAEAALAEAAKSKAEAEAALAQMKKDKEACAAEAESAKAELISIQKAAVAKERFSKLASVDATASLGSEVEALASLRDMADAVFETVFKVSEAQYKKAQAAVAATSTSQTLTNAPKSTDQTLTNAPKSTDQTQSAKAMENAKVDEEVIITSVVTNNGPTALQTFAGKRIGQKLGKTKKTDKSEK